MASFSSVVDTSRPTLWKVTFETGLGGVPVCRAGNGGEPCAALVAQSIGAERGGAGSSCWRAWSPTGQDVGGAAPCVATEPPQHARLDGPMAVHPLEPRRTWPSPSTDKNRSSSGTPACAPCACWPRPVGDRRRGPGRRPVCDEPSRGSDQGKPSRPQLGPHDRSTRRTVLRRTKRGRHQGRRGPLMAAQTAPAPTPSRTLTEAVTVAVAVDQVPTAPPVAVTGPRWKTGTIQRRK